MTSRRDSIRRFGHRAKWRWRYSILAFGAGTATTWVMRKHILAWMIAPAEGRLSPFEGGPPVFFGPADIFGISFKLAIYGGLAVGLPVLLTGFYLLISQHLPRMVRLFVGLMVPISVLLFAAGVAFVYYVMLPVSLRFLLSFGSDVAVPLISLEEYLGLLIALMFWIGLVFDLPVLMYVLSRTGVVPFRRFKRVPRRIVLGTAAVLATLITPTFDLANWGMVMLPILGLWEAGLFASWLADPQGDDYMGMRKAWRALTWPARKLLVVLTFLRVPWVIGKTGKVSWWVLRKARWVLNHRPPWWLLLAVGLVSFALVAVRLYLGGYVQVVVP